MNEDCQKKCIYVFKKGINKGIQCTLNADTDSHYCKKHSSTVSFQTSSNNNNGEGSSSETLLRSAFVEELLDNFLKKEVPIKSKILELDTTMENKLYMFKHYANMKSLDESSTEYYKNKTWLDNALSIPFNKYATFIDNTVMSTVASTIASTVASTNKQIIGDLLKSIHQSLDQHVYGLENVKQEIMNFVMKMIVQNKTTNSSNVIGLYGKAGIGKTRIVKGLSQILKIPLKTIPLGGSKDCSFLSGHSFVYVESRAGKVMNSIIESKVMNPILFFDELDKVSKSEFGHDIYSFLIHLTDPSQNNQFHDHYFTGLNIDLSKCFFIFAMNDLSEIDPILLDRMHLIHIPSPTDAEKYHIIKDYIFKEHIQNLNIQCTMSDETIHHIIKLTEQNNNTSGLRYAKHIIEKVLVSLLKDYFMSKLDSIPEEITIEHFDKYIQKLEDNVQSDMWKYLYL